jgi:hypothetical protein
MRTVVSCALALAIIAALSEAVTTQGAVAQIGGRWTVTFKQGSETVTGLALLDQFPDNRVTGSVGVNEQNQHPLDGVIEGNRVTLTTHPRPGRTVAFAKVVLNVDGDKMIGTTEGGDLKTPTAITFVKQSSNR